MEDLRKCNCGGEAEVTTEFYPNTKYKMYRVRCSACQLQTTAKRRLKDAIDDWNNPIRVKLN